MSFTIKASRTNGTASLNTLTKQRSIPSHRMIDLSDQFLKIVGHILLEADYVILVMYKTRELKQPRRPTTAKTLLKNFRLLRLSNVGVTFQEQKFLMTAF